MLPKQIKDYLELGWYLLPVQAQGKAPLGGQGYDHASNDPKVVEGWARGFRGCRWGVACDKSKLVVIDVDRHAGQPDGTLALAELQARLGELPDCPKQTTPRGGYHLLFKHPGGGVAFKGQLGPGVDIKSSGYVVLYADDLTAPSTPLPQAWLEHAKKKAAPRVERGEFKTSVETTAYGRRALDGECRAVESAPAGTRNHTLNTSAYRIGQLVAGGEVLESDARRELESAALAAGLDNGETPKTMDSGLESGMKQPRSAPQDAHRDDYKTRGQRDAQDHEPLSMDHLAPTMGSLYGLEQLRATAQRKLLALDELPGPRDGMPHGLGMGDDFNKALGGGVCAGYLLGVAANRAGGGKTAFVMQLADGLALRCIEGGDGLLTPVLVASEMRADELQWRSIARWTGLPVHAFRAGASYERPAEPMQLAEPAWDGNYGKSKEWIRRYQGGGGEAFFSNVRSVLSGWCDELQQEHERDVLPILVVDPMQRWAGRGPELDAVNEFIDRLGELVNDLGAVCFATSDTTKSAATGGDKGKDSQQEGTAAFRGTYRLLHMFDAALFLGGDDHDNVKAELVKNRYGKPGEAGRFKFDGARMRYTPVKPRGGFDV